MSGYKFCIDMYMPENNFLAYDNKEQKLFDIEGIDIILKSHGGEMISKSKLVSLNSGLFNDLEKCICIAKKVYANFLLKLSSTGISYILFEGNFTEFCKDDDAYLYKEIRIQDAQKFEPYGFCYYKTRKGNRDLSLNTLLDVKMDKKLKDSILINNYRKSLLLNDIASIIDNTLLCSSLEMLLDPKELKSKEELEVIEETCDYLNNRYTETKNEAYKKIKECVENLKAKSIKSKAKDLVTKYSSEENRKNNLKLLDNIGSERGKEVHNSKEKDIKYITYSDDIYNNFINEIQINYAKELYEKEEVLN